MASVKATHSVLGGPGRWILALSSHHIAGAQVLMRAAATEISPQIVDCSHGFDPKDLLPAITGATSDPSLPGYLSLVPTQLVDCLDAGDEVVSALARLHTILIGGTDPALRQRAEDAGLTIVESFGITRNLRRLRIRRSSASRSYGPHPRLGRYHPHRDRWPRH